MHDLTLAEQFAVNGGDWFERYWGFMMAMAFLGGAAATPAFLAIAAMAGAALLTTDYMVNNNIDPFAFLE